ncbi:hypothetical protein M2310_006941 [Rhizobium leguminosarum]|jgi:hypothetical protein|uniref:Uncharacterized protein n=1 Tax=Rhizobium esperanzae TaxID=1967781 RepID=A0A7W6USV4_9HYPH|nr:hypothetical protein [Rhizobium esperanzae]MDH6206249.1 hypothetical protein [Rhizobium leguminosarum]
MCPYKERISSQARDNRLMPAETASFILSVTDGRTPSEDREEFT